MDKKHRTGNKKGKGGRLVQSLYIDSQCYLVD